MEPDLQLLYGAMPISTAWEGIGGTSSHTGASQERGGVNLLAVAVLQLTDLCRAQVERRKRESSQRLQRSRVPKSHVVVEPLFYWESHPGVCL